MSFYKRSRKRAGTLSHALGSACGGALLGFARGALALSIVVLVAVGILYIRLIQGPVELPGLGRYLVERANASSETVRVDVGTLVLNLGDATTPAGLEFKDVQVASPDGTSLFVVPRLRASFDMLDLIRGEVRPTRISVVSADAQFIRGADGRIRFGLGQGDGVSLETADGATDDGGATTTAAGSEAVSKLIDGFVGDAELAREVSKLRKIEILDTRIIFSDRMAGGRVVTRRASLRIKRDPGGATARLDIVRRQGIGQGEIVRLFADRRKGAGSTSITGKFGRVDLKKLAGFLPAVAGLENIDTEIEGEISARFDRTGWPTRLRGTIVSDGGHVALDGTTHPFDFASLDFSADMVSGVIDVANGQFSGPSGRGDISGLFHLTRNGAGMIRQASAQIDIHRLEIPANKQFEEPLVFDHGQIVAGWSPDRAGLQIADSWLGQGDFDLRFSGRITEEGADLRAETKSMGVDRLIRYWPMDKAANARAWIAKNITKAELKGMTAEIRLRGDDAVLAMSAGFSGLDSTFVEGMEPIRGAAGELFVNLDRLDLRMSAGKVSAGDRAISLAGSSMVITGFDDPVTPADIQLRAKGDTETVLALIDQKPLGLVGALGLDLGKVQGVSEISARLKFPLIAALKVSDVFVKANAVLRDTRMQLALTEIKPSDLRASELKVFADVEKMRVSGDVTVDGTPINVDWREDYSTKPGTRKLRLTGQVTPEVLSQAGIPSDALTGKARVAIDLNQKGKDPMRFALKADLEGAGLSIEPLDWSKERGVPASLTAEGRLGPDTTDVKLLLEAPGLRADGDIAIGPDGELKLAQFRRVVMPGKLDARVSIERAADGVPNIWIAGRLLDVSNELSGGSDGAEKPKDPVRIRLELEQFRVTETLVINAADGRIERLANGTLTGEITGALGPDAPVSVSIEFPAQGDGRVILKSSNAGAALRHADIYRGAVGGTLRVDARIPQGPGAAVTGQAIIDDVTVRSQSTFRDVLENGGLSDPAEAVSSGGLSFRSVSIPFRYVDGIVTVTDAIAVSPVLGLKMTGTLNENTDAVDLIGVLSPAYALTGALNEIPLLGQILSGGRGEGIVGMTFTLKGAMRDPRFSVNPLSLLAPGFLRKLFTGTSGGDADREFDPQGSQPQR